MSCLFWNKINRSTERYCALINQNLLSSMVYSHMAHILSLQIQVLTRSMALFTIRLWGARQQVFILKHTVEIEALMHGKAYLC